MVEKELKEFEKEKRLFRSWKWWTEGNKMMSPQNVYALIPRVSAYVTLNGKGDFIDTTKLWILS